MTGPPPGSTRLVDRFRDGRAGIILRLAGILVIAVGLRSYRLGQLSFWYDETVTMRLAQAANPARLIARLGRIDATRAPLHPILLEGWIRAFGQSETSARALSVLGGVATVALVFAIGQAGFDVSTGLWAAWLAALSPALIVYSREARMYAWLVLAASVCWWILLNLSNRFSWQRATVYVLAQALLGYTHPLGLIMMATLALAGLAGLRSCFGTIGRWLAVHLAAGVMVAPWIVRYLDHPPEFLSGVQPIKVLLGTPIGFIGGDSRVLGVLVLLIGWGILGSRARLVGMDDAPIVPARNGNNSGSWLVPGFLLLWLIVPPLTLFVYSRLGRPIFGPQRYTVFVAPAYLLLVARGLVRTPASLRYPLAAGLTILALLELGPKVYAPDLKADWRGFAADLTARAPGAEVLVIVAPLGEGPNVEVETARYYLPSDCRAIGLEEATPERLANSGEAEIYLAIGARGGKPVVPPPDRLGPFVFRPAAEYPGLTVLRAEHRAPDLRTARGGRSRPGARSHGGTAGSHRLGAGIRLEHRQHDGFQVALKRGAGHAEGLLRRGTDLEALLLQAVGNGAQAESLDQAKRRLDLRVLGQVVPLAGAEVTRADCGRPRAVDRPSAAGAADPERGLDRGSVQFGRERQRHDDRTAAAPPGDRLELLEDRVRAIRGLRGGALGIQQALQLAHDHRGVDPSAGEGHAARPFRHHHALVADESEPVIHGDLGRGAAAKPHRVGLGRRGQQALQRDRPIGRTGVHGEPAGLEGIGQLGGRHALRLGEPGLPGQHEAAAGTGRPAVQLPDLGPRNPDRDERRPGGPRGVGQPRELPVDPAKNPIVRRDARCLLPLLLPGLQPRPSLLDRALGRRVAQAIPVLQVTLHVLLGPAAADEELDHTVRGVRPGDRPADHRAVAHRDLVGRRLVGLAESRRAGRQQHAEGQQESGHDRVRLIVGVARIGISGRSSRY